MSAIDIIAIPYCLALLYNTKQHQSNNNTRKKMKEIDEKPMRMAHVITHR